MPLPNLRGIARSRLALAHSIFTLPSAASCVHLIPIAQHANVQSNSATRRQVITSTNMPDYPGLGLPLRHNPQRDYGFYPIGAHGSCYGADSKMLPVREVAMMSIMDRLTDKEDWHKKVFDDTIVSKWRKEAMAIPDEHFWKLATGDKRQWWNKDTGELKIQDDFGSNHVKPLKGVMNAASFDCVSLAGYPLACFVR